MSFTFLISPYTGTRAQQEERYHQACSAAHYLHKRGMQVFSPIVHWHPIAKFYNLPEKVDYWWSMSQTFLTQSNSVTILCIHGWLESVGCRREINFAKRCQLQRYYLTPSGREFSLNTVPPLER